jgi:dipeptidyl aminopeptidase/acylaminoacyl peptidase
MTADGYGPRFAGVGLAAVTLATALLAPDATAATEPFSIEHLVRLKRISEPSLSPDGKTVAFTVRETDMQANRGRTDIWAYDLASKQPQLRRLTNDPENDSSPQWSPDGGTVYFLSTRSGSSQIWRLQSGATEAEPVTQLPLDVGSYRLAPDGRRLAVSLEVYPDCEDLACTVQRMQGQKEQKATGVMHERLFVRHWDAWSDHRQSRLFVINVDSDASEPVMIGGQLDADVPSKPFGDASEYTFSPDGQRIVFSARLKGRSEAWSTNFDLFEQASDGSGEPRNLTADNLAWDAQPIFSRDGRYLAWRAMTRPGFEADRFRIVLRDLKSGEQRVLTESWDRSADGIAFSHDGKSIFTQTDHFGQRPLWRVEVKSGKPNLLTGPGRVEAYAVGEREIVFSVASLRSPAELQLLNLRNGDMRELPRLNAEALQNVALGEVEQFTFAGWNGETVHGHVVKPANFRPDSKYPVAFIVHGGPQVSFGNAWSYRWNPQTYAGAGYAAVFIDFHGSPGYGQAFTDSITEDWGGKPLEDLQKGWEAALARFGWLDGDRACALGASYGGYMMNWMASQWSAPFKCFVNHAGIFDNRFMAYSTEELWFGEWEFGGPPYEVPENIERQNPVTHVAEWEKPMLVIHGQRDYRVPYTQGLATFTALQRRGIPSKLLIFPDENHWVLKPANSIQWHNEVNRWLHQWTRPTSGSGEGN